MSATLRLARYLLVVLATGAYLILAHLTTAPDEPSTLGALVAVLPIAVIALAMAWRARHRRRALGLWSVCVIGSALAWPLIETRFVWVYFVQHLGVFMLLAVGFARSLAIGEVPMITRFARQVHGEALAPEVLRYTRAVTLAWTLYFAAMAIASIILFAFASLPNWSLFVNLFTPVSVGLVFAVEFGVRLAVLPHELRTGLVDSIRAFFDSVRRHSPTAS